MTGPARRSARVRSPLRVAALVGGILALAAAVIPPVDHAASERLSIHMVQHLLLVVVAAPLLVLGRTGLVLWVRLPSPVRRALRGVARRRGPRSVLRSLTHPVVAWGLHATALWVWHAPPAYQAAVDSELAHAAEHGVFLGTAVLFWEVALRPRRAPSGIPVLYVLTAWMQGGALGALLTFAPAPIYPVYAERAAALAIDPLRDQQVAGLLMWLPAGLVYLGAAAVLFASWLKGVAREDDRVGLAEVVRA